MNAHEMFLQDCKIKLQYFNPFENPKVCFILPSYIQLNLFEDTPKRKPELEDKIFFDFDFINQEWKIQPYYVQKIINHFKNK